MKKLMRSIWATLVFVALLALIDIFLSPSSAAKARVLGLSAQRLALALFPFMFLLFSLIFGVMVRFAPVRYERLMISCKLVSSRHAMLSGSFCFWAALFLAGITVSYRLEVTPNLVALTDKLGSWFPILCGYMDRLWPVLLFVAACMAGWSLIVLLELKLRFYQSALRFIGSAAAVICLFATCFQWIVFVFRLNVFDQIPGWYWPIRIKPDFAGHAVLFALFFLFFALILVLLKRFPRALGLHIVLICLGFIGLQYAIGYMEGRGIASLTDRFFLSYHRIYTEQACNATVSVHDAIKHYEDLYPQIFLQTKPPGVLWMSFEINQVANTPWIASLLDRQSVTISLSKFLPTMAAAACQRDMALVTLLLPFLAASTVGIMYGFTKWLLCEEDQHLLMGYSAILCVLAPNLVMLGLFLDQALYPPLFLLMATGILLAVRKKFALACFLMGAAVYVALFLSFSLLPLLVIPLFYFACIAWQDHRWSALWENFKSTLLPMGLGGLLSMALFKVFLNYDIFTRYQHMMATRIEGDFYTRFGLQSTGNVSILVKIQQAWDAAKLNNIELAVAIGFPVFIFFVVVGVRSLIHVLRRETDPAAAINSSLFLAYVALNSMRVVLGEVARLWMFWIPVMALLAVQFLLPFMRRNRWLIFALVAMQFVTLFLSYQYQDYFMPQLLP